MEKKFKFSDKSKVSKLVYATVIAILCVSAIVIGIVAANSRRQVDTENPDSGITDGSGNNNGGSTDGGSGNNGGSSGDTGSGDTPAPQPKLSFVSPVVGTVIKSHSTTVPVFSETLDEWRIHTGIDISTAENAEVYAAEAGKVSAVYNDPMLGKTVEITHSDSHKTRYSNLSADSVKLAVGDEVAAGALLGNIGESSISELCDEPHLHFEMLVNDAMVNPLDYISEESKEASLGIVSGEEEAA